MIFAAFFHVFRRYDVSLRAMFTFTLPPDIAAYALFRLSALHDVALRATRC